MKTFRKQHSRLIVAGCLFICLLTLKLSASVYFLQTQGNLPYPSDPYHGTVPITTLDAPNGIFQILDTPADFAALANSNRTNNFISSTNQARRTPNTPGNSDPNGFDLNIDTDDDNFTRIVYFNTSPGSVYSIQSSTNLTDWSVEQAFIATDTNHTFLAVPDGNKFYRIELPDNRLQFPDWDDYVEAFAFFNVHTTISGTYHLELYADGNLLFQRTASVPVGGNFGVYDGGYDASQWPNVAGYAADEWSLNVTVTPSAAGVPQAQANVKKRQRHSTHPRFGLTIAREGVGAGVAPGGQEAIDMYMVGYLKASGDNVANQLSLAPSLLDPSTVQYFNVPKLTDTNSWAQFKTFLNNPNSTDLHYFGHGSQLGIGDSLADPTASVSLAEFQNTNRLTHPLKYAAMDGCKTASGNHWWQKSQLLAALCGYDRKVTLTEARSKGNWPRFAWGWTSKKVVNFASGTQLQIGHFNFITDVYSDLSVRDANGFLIHSFDHAINFGLHPNGLGNNPFTFDNPDGFFLDYLGCGEARWDD